MVCTRPKISGGGGGQRREGSFDQVASDRYRRVDNITDYALAHFRRLLPADSGLLPVGREISKDDIYYYVYGLLHSPDYRQRYANELKREYPRIPVVEDFAAFAAAGKLLNDIHLGYESATPYPLKGLDVEASGDPYDFYAVKKMEFGKPTAEQKAAGEKKGTIIYNDNITLSGIPEDAYRYTLGGHSAIEWIIDRYKIKIDKDTPAKKRSGIKNDPNDWSRQVGNPRYILDLLARIVTVSVETMQIVDSLPELKIIPPRPS